MRPLLLVSLALFCVIGLAANVASAADFYVDPEAGSMQNDGSAQHPWSTLREVMEADLVETQTWDTLPHEPDSTSTIPSLARRGFESPRTRTGPRARPVWSATT